VRNGKLILNLANQNARTYGFSFTPDHNELLVELANPSGTQLFYRTSVDPRTDVRELCVSSNVTAADSAHVPLASRACQTLAWDAKPKGAAGTVPNVEAPLKSASSP
jgi:hypothetical protein